MNKLVTSVGIIVLFIVGAYFVLHSSSTTTITPKENEVEVEKPTLLVDQSFFEEKSYKTPTQYATFDVSYPQFKNVSPDFNQKIANLVNTEINNHTKDSEDNWKARYDTRSPGDTISEFPSSKEKYSLSITWTSTQLNKNFISGVFVFSGYVGGAHGYENIISFNYDVGKQKEITLVDLFPNDSQYLKTISEFSRKDLTAQFRKRLEIKTKADEANFKEVVVPMMEAGTTPDEINFSVFTFTENKVTFYFNQYQVAPYAMGQSIVGMPRK